MRRIAVWTLSTVTVLVLLFGYHTSTSSRFAPTQAAVAARQDADHPAALPRSGTFDGDTVVTRFGRVQVRIVVADGRIATVKAVQVPTGDRHNDAINARAVPILDAAAVEAQSADLDLVSGATLTSQGYMQSLQSAIDKASA